MYLIRPRSQSPGVNDYNSDRTILLTNTFACFSDRHQLNSIWHDGGKHPTPHLSRTRACLYPSQVSVPRILQTPSQVSVPRISQIFHIPEFLVNPSTLSHVCILFSQPNLRFLHDRRFLSCVCVARAETGSVHTPATDLRPRRFISNSCFLQFGRRCTGRFCSFLSVACAVFHVVLLLAAFTSSISRMKHHLW